MKGVVVSLIGGLCGVVAGSLLPWQSVAAMFSPTSITWDATGCPAGVYTVTSSARSSNGTVYLTPAMTVKLPRKEVVQQFANLPAGTYSVSATVKRHDGRMIPSGSQTLTSDGSGVGLTMRRRPPATEVAGRASPRTAGSSPGSRTGLTAARSAGTNAAPASLIGGVRFIPDDLPRQIEILDLDADGIMDVVRVELFDGREWHWREISIPPGGIATVRLREK